MEKFSLRSRRAILLFTILFLAFVLVPRIVFYFKQPETFSLSEKLKKVPEKERQNLQKNIKEYNASKVKKRHLFKTPPEKFDPNTYQLTDWMFLGLSAKQAQTILNFNKYGFYSEADLQKCFVFQNEDFFAIIKDSLVFPEKTPAKKYDKAYKANLAVDLNRATKEQLMELKGIGNYFADKIIAYRERLGGFITVNQLLEIYKFDTEKLEMIKPYLLLNKNDVKKMNLNTIDVKTLKNHPYINDWNLANSIVKMREQKERYTTIEEIKESVLITDSVFRKIEAYITVK